MKKGLCTLCSGQLTGQQRLYCTACYGDRSKGKPDAKPARIWLQTDEEVAAAADAICAPPPNGWAARMRERRF